MSFSDVVRKEFKASDEARDAGLSTPDDVIRFDDIYYACEGKSGAAVVFGQDSHDRKDGFLTTESGSFTKERSKTDDRAEQNDRWHLLDVYRPKSAGKSKLPVIVNVHGGGWVYGDKDVYQYYCMDLCLRGYAVVNFSYRLAPEYKFPAQLEDTNTTFRWILGNAEKYGFDLERIYAVGDSAGANILSLYCLMCTNEEYAAGYDFKTSSKTDYIAGDDNYADNEWRDRLLPRAVGLNCGAYNLSISKREMKGFMTELMPEKGTEEEIEMLNVTKYINKDFPPTFLMTCYGDFLKDQAPLLEKKLEEMGVTYVSRLYGSEEHPLKHVFHCDIRMEEAKVCNDETCEFFESIL